MKYNGKKSTTLSIRKYLAAITIGLGLSSSLSASYTVETVAGSAGVNAHTDGVGSVARFKSPGMLSINLLTGDLLEPDSDNNIREISTTDDLYTVSTLFKSSSSYNQVETVCSYVGNTLLTTDDYTHLWQWVQSGGTYVYNTSLDAVSGVDSYYSGKGLVVDNSNNIFMTDGPGKRIWKILPDGSYSVFVQNDSLNGLTGITIDSSNNLYVSATGNNTICKITATGVITTIAGTAGSSGSADGTGAAARFNNPWDIDIDAAGNLYVADRGNNLIRKLTNNGGIYTVSTIAGTAGSSGSSDGVGSAALFNAPTGLAVDAFGYVFVTDTNNDTIRRLLPPSINIEVDGTDSATVSGPITNHARKTGTGTIVVSGDNSSLLNTSINQGLTKISSTNHMGKSLTLNGGDMEITSGTVAIPTADLRSAATVTTDASATVSSVAAPYGSALLTFAGAGIVTAGDMSTSSTPVSIPGIMHVGASSSSKLTTGATTVPSGGLLKIMGATASSIPGDAEVQSGGVLEVDTGVNVPADTGADIFGTLQINDGATLKLGNNTFWGRNVTVGTAL